MFITTIRQVHQQGKIFLYPIIFDMLAFIIGLSLVGFIGESMVSIKLILEMGFPSVSHLSNIAIFANQTSILNEFNAVPIYVIAIVIILILVRTYLQGGYIQYLSHIIDGKTYHISMFLKNGKKYWIQFILLEIIVYLFKITLSTFLIIFFPLSGTAFTLLLLIGIRIVFIYLEFTIVAKNVSVHKALKLCRSYFLQSFFPTITLVSFMYALTVTLSYLLHNYWSYGVILIMIIVYSYMMTLIQAIFMNLFKQVTYS